jgi:hypothetical protein
MNAANSVQAQQVEPIGYQNFRGKLSSGVRVKNSIFYAIKAALNTENINRM